MIKLILTTLIIAILAPLTVSAGAVLELPESTFNFGIVPQHAVFYHTFWIKSVGDEDLVIDRVKPGCGCTQAPFQDSVLAPGDSTRLTIIFDSKTFRGKTIKYPSIVSNASDTEIKLQFMSEPVNEKSDIRPVIVEPMRIDVSQFTERIRRKAKFTLTNKSNYDLKVKLVEKSSDDFEVELPDFIPANGEAIGKVIVNDSAIEKEFGHSFTFDIGDGQQRFSLPLKRMIRKKGR